MIFVSRGAILNEVAVSIKWVGTRHDISIGFQMLNGHGEHIQLRNPRIEAAQPSASGEAIGSRHFVEIPGVSGGDKCIPGTRIPVWAVEAARRAEIDDIAILEMYPMITPRLLESAKQYADHHFEEMSRLIAENQDA